MALYKQPRSKYWFYYFRFNGKRYRASTGKTTKSAAATVEAAALTALARGEEGVTKIARGATLRMLSERFLEWVQRNTELSDSSRKYYTYGWRLLSNSPLASLRVDGITRDDIICTTFRRKVVDRRTNEETDVEVECSPAYRNQALRTLKVMLGKAEDWKLIAHRPKFAVPKSPRREAMIDGATEAALQTAYAEPANHRRVDRQRLQAWIVMVIHQDSGMRPDEVFPMRIEDIQFGRHRIWVPEGKTPNSTRFVTMSHRMYQLLRMWCGDRKEGWVFPSSRSATGHLTTIAKGFKTARLRGNIDPRIVPYSARHTFGTFAMGATKNIFAVSKSMGHADIKSMEPYQHPELDEINDAINRRNRERDRKPGPEPTLEFPENGHTFGHTRPFVN